MPKRRPDDPLIVYSTEHGLVCPACRNPVARCTCRKAAPPPAGDGIVRVRREVKGRGGKAVTTVSGVPMGADALRELSSDLKRRCGTGGTVKDGVIEIQGDHRDILIAFLTERGYTVKRAGG